MPSPPGHVADFKLSITKALADQLAERLEPLRPAPLTADAIQAMEQRPGVYLLYHRGHRVYVGKAQHRLPTRLRKHWQKLIGRDGIDLTDVSFVALHVDEDLDAVAPETLLIRKYRAARGPDGVPWNVNGFGNNDPGRNRDRSEVPSNHFDAIFPARLDWPIQLPSTRLSLANLLATAKSQLPFNFRYQASDVDADVHVESTDLTVADVMRVAIGTLPEAWQATALPGYVILYPERVDFPSARVVWRKVDGEVRASLLDPRLAAPREIDEDPGSDS